ncbi:hypothetical protein RYX36_005241 [Vicia faba]
MADIVQYKLERMVDELEDLEQRGLFTRQEIAEIVKQQRKFELRKNGRIKKALAKLVRLHPNRIMKEGLIFCPTSEDLWVEYLRMELTYLNKLKARKFALGEDKGTLTRDPRTEDDKQLKDENKELFMTLDE